jgi:hypothetical protein
LSGPPSQSDEELPDRQLDLEDTVAQLTIVLHGHDPLLMSNPDEHGSNQLVVNASSDPPSSLPNNIATLSFRNDDHDLRPMLLSQSHSHQSSLTPSFFDNLPAPPACDPEPPAPPQPCINPPLSVLPQAQPYPPPPLASNNPPPPSQQSDEELLAPEHGLHLEDDKESSNHDLARLIALHGYDPALVEDDCFRSFVASLNPEYKLPSRLTVEETCDGIFDEAREDLLSRLRRSHRKVSLAVGKTKTVHGEVLYTACHFIDDEWKLHKVVMDAYLVTPFPILYGPLLGVPEVTFSGEAQQTKFSKLGVKDIMRSLLLETDNAIFDRMFVIVWGIKDIQMIRFMKRIVTDYTFCMDTMLHEIATSIIFHPKFTESIYEKVYGLHMTREKRQQLFSHMGLDHLPAYSEHWYSCYCSLEFLRQHGSCTIEDKDYSQLIQLLCKIWGVIYRAMQTISTSSCPTSNQYLVEMFKVREILQSELERIDGDDSIVYSGHSGVFVNDADAADLITQAKKELDENMESSYLEWSVPLVVDPRYKLDYIKSIFRRAFGTEGTSKVSRVRRNINKLYADYVEYDGGINGEGSESDGDSSGDGSSDDTGSYLDARNELDLYLNDPRVEATQDFDILNWWKDNNSKYPTVARMARDALAMPTCSKLSSEQMAHVSSIVRGYSKKRYMQAKYEP